MSVPGDAVRRAIAREDGTAGWCDGSEHGRRRDILRGRAATDSSSVGAGGSTTFDDDDAARGSSTWTADDDAIIGVTDRTPLLPASNRQVASHDEDAEADRRGRETTVRGVVDG